MQTVSETLIAARPGYLGGQRDQTQAGWDTQYGAGNWQLMWQWGSQLLDLAGALMLYEDAYLEFLRHQPDVLAQLVAEASNVYDDAPSNVHSGLDYMLQETNLNHWHDVAIRRVITRLGYWFTGTELVQIRHELSPHPLSMALSPGQIPFHRPDMICRPQKERWWWEPDSVESFYQSNKVLVVAG